MVFVSNMEEDGQNLPVTDNPFSFKHFLKKPDRSNDAGSSCNHITSGSSESHNVNVQIPTSENQDSGLTEEIPFPDVQQVVAPLTKKTKGKKVRNKTQPGLSEQQDENPFSFKNFVKKDAAVKSSGRVLQIVDDEICEVNVKDNVEHLLLTVDENDIDKVTENVSDLVLKPPELEINSQDEITKLQNENDKLNKELQEAKQAKENESKKVASLLKKLKEIEQKENEETAALEKMVHMVEKNLELTTQRALKAEAVAAKLREENKSLKGSVSKATYDELVSDHYTSLVNIKEQANNAAEQLNATAIKAEESLKQLYAGVDSFKLVSQLLQSIDKISTVTKDDSLPR